MRRALALFGVAAALGLAASPAGATLGPMVKVRFASEPRAAAAGEVYRGAFEVLARRAGEVAELRLEGEGWSGAKLESADAAGLAAGGPATLAAGQTVLFQFEATPSDPAQPLWVALRFAGREVRKRFDLSPESIARLGKPERAVQVPESERGPEREEALAPTRDPEVRLSEGKIQPVPARPRRPGEKPRRETPEVPASPQSPNGLTVYVHGRFVFKDFDGNWVGAHGMTVRVYDEDWDWDAHLGTTGTDANGYWGITVYSSEDEPDIYMEFETANSQVEVEDDSILEENYVWTSGVHEDWTGGDLDHGWSAPAVQVNPRPYILNVLTRTWVRLFNLGYGPSSVDCQFPEDDATNAFYDGEIHIPWNRRWRANSMAHEYGHHWVTNYAADQTPSYCNGICDSGDCGHCAWCQENQNDGWNEGFPDWLSESVVNWMANAYNANLNITYAWESTGPCKDSNGNPCSCTPASTEGFVAALLHDIEDGGSGDTDPNALPSGTDATAMGMNEILAVTANFNPLVVGDFISFFLASYPNACGGLWRTTRNNGFTVQDNTPPGIVTNLVSTSHQVGLQDSSADKTINFTWTTASDNCSGTSGYSVWLRVGGPALPNATADIGNVTSYVATAPLAGTYWFCIRARDRAGNWDNSYANIGPIVIRQPHPADLAVVDRTGWDFPVVPRPDFNASLQNVQAPTQLLGNSATTRYNWTLANVGELASAVSSFKVKTFVDGEQAGTYTASTFLDPGEELGAVNIGPITVRGGRHTFEAFADADEEWQEPYEDDNRWAKQWVWNPQQMSTLSLMVRSAPPDRTGGWDAIVNSNWPDPQSGPWDNCDGLRMPDLRYLSGARWKAAAAFAQDNADNYTVDLHYPVPWNYVENGFNIPIHRSLRPAGCLDAVIANGNKDSGVNWDIGVVNSSGGSSDYVADYQMSDSIAVPDSIAVTMGQDEMIRLWHFEVAPAKSGYALVSIFSDSLPLHLLWYEPGTVTATLTQADAQGTTDAAGHGYITFYAAGGPDPHGLVVYRDPKDGTGPISFGLKTRLSPHDYAMSDPPGGWDASVVPRDLPDGRSDAVAKPVRLVGDSIRTYINFALKNDSPFDGPSLFASLCVDDSCIQDYPDPGAPAESFSLHNETTPFMVPGGRHTIAVVLDRDNRLLEYDEDDNAYGEQYVWEPTPVGYGMPVTRPVPGDPYGGWDFVPYSDVEDESGQVSEPLWVNVDGLRTPNFAGIRLTGPLWGGVGVIPGPGTDVDLRLFETSTGAKDGFDSTLVMSGWGVGLTEFVLMNFSMTPRRAFDFGVETMVEGMPPAGGSAPTYTAEVVSSMYVGDPVPGGIGPFTLEAGHVMQLFVLDLGVGRYRFTLGNRAGTVDWGMSLYAADMAYTSKGLYYPLGASWSAGPGMDEQFELNFTKPDVYCMAVWKKDSGALPQSGTYDVSVGLDLTDVPEGAAPGRTALAPVSPNPVRAQATIGFDLAAAGEVALDVYDLRGARVRTLTAGAWPAGRHTIRWDGADDRGRRLAAGVYVVRMQAAGVEATRKVVVVE